MKLDFPDNRCDVVLMASWDFHFILWWKNLAMLWRILQFLPSSQCQMIIIFPSWLQFLLLVIKSNITYMIPIDDTAWCVRLFMSLLTNCRETVLKRASITALNGANMVKSEEDELPSTVANVSREDIRKYAQCKRVGNYLLGRTVGEGSFAKVKEAFHVLTGEKVLFCCNNFLS